MASATIHAIRCLFGLVFLSLIVLGCSADDANQADPDSASASNEADGEIDDTEGTDNSANSANSDGNEDDREADDGAEEAAAGRTLATEGHASVTELVAGEQVEDAQGNLIAIYGFSRWSDAVSALSDAARSEFVFFGDVEDASDPDAALLVLDVGMCSAGIDAEGFGTAEFFLHKSPEDVLSTDQVLDRGVLARHPVVQPGFRFPAAAECSRGFLPVLWSGEDDPVSARYVLASRSSADADIERHVYQWNIDGVAVDIANAEPDAASRFAAGQTVTFNDGRLAETSVVFDGWAERVGAASEIEGTRVVAVSLTICPASAALPDFGLAVDGWNILAPLPSDFLKAAASLGESTSCVDGWLDFAVPFGGEPTAFFASDGANSVVGYAEWPLVGAALPVPQ